MGILLAFAAEQLIPFFMRIIDDGFAVLVAAAAALESSLLTGVARVAGYRLETCLLFVSR